MNKELIPFKQVEVGQIFWIGLAKYEKTKRRITRNVPYNVLDASKKYSFFAMDDMEVELVKEAKDES